MDSLIEENDRLRSEQSTGQSDETQPTDGQTSIPPNPEYEKTIEIYKSKVITTIAQIEIADSISPQLAGAHR